MYSKYLHSDGKVVLFDDFIVQRMIDLDVSIGFALMVSLLNVEGVVLVGLIGRSSHQLVKDSWIVFDSRAKRTKLMSATMFENGVLSRFRGDSDAGTRTRQSDMPYWAIWQKEREKDCKEAGSSHAHWFTSKVHSTRTIQWSMQGESS